MRNFTPYQRHSNYLRNSFVRQNMNGSPVVIESKFPGWCSKCGIHFDAGTRINYQRGLKPWHEVCPQVNDSGTQRKYTRINIEDAGVYVLPDGTIVKVQSNRAKTHTYTMRFHEIMPERALEAGGRVNGDYEYKPELMGQVVENGRKMTLEEAKAFMVKYGFCCRCGRHLVAAKSVEDGIGPVCIQYFGGK